MKKKVSAPITMALCSWCQKVAWPKGKGKQVDREFLLSESKFKVADFLSHGICTACAKELLKQIEPKKNPSSNPPAWVKDKGKWKEAVRLAQLSYGQKIGSRQVRDAYAVIVTIYKNLGGRVNRKVKRNPSEGEWQAVIDLFGEFHDFGPTTAVVHKVDSLHIPGVLVKIGDLVEVTYKSDKFDRRSRLYVHKFGRDKPVLAASKDGRLFLVGGGYRITSRGIER